MATHATAATTMSESANELILPFDLITGDITMLGTKDIPNVDSNGEVLNNIIESNERLSQKLAKMPPLSKLTIGNNTESATPISNLSHTKQDENTKCFCPSFLPKKSKHEHILLTPAMRRRNSSNNAACYRKIIIKTHDSGYSNVAVTARTQPTDIKKTLHCSTQDHSLDTHPEQNRLEQHQEQKAYQQQYWSIPAKASTANAVCYHPCKTDPLPWWQQHLVLNQTVYNANSCQPPCQIPCLTVDTGSTATACKGQHSNSLEARIKPKLYFEQLLKRNGCHRKPRPPVKVDVNVRIVPKKSRENPSTSQKTFIKELDEVTQTLNETFIKDNSSERANIIDHLVYFDNDLDNDDDRKQVTQLKIVHEQ